MFYGIITSDSYLLEKLEFDEEFIVGKISYFYDSDVRGESYVEPIISGGA